MRHKKQKNQSIVEKIAKAMAHMENEKGFIEPWSDLETEVKNNYMDLAKVAVRMLANIKL